MRFLSQRNIFVVSALILVSAAAGYFVWRDFNGIQNQAVTEPNSGQVINDKPDYGQVKVQEKAVNKTYAAVEPNVPNLDRPVKVSANLSEGEKEKFVSEIKEISAALKDNHNDFDRWLQLGILQKMIGDYDGAAESWNFAAVISPKSTIPFLNLADLYAYYFRNNKKAEESFALAVAADPQNSFPYFQIARFYDDVLKDKERARNILRQGISAGADAADYLKLLLDSL
ncbi:MAG: hypothetical protein AAB474_00790 [Patescibacteria group bacterium]